MDYKPSASITELNIYLGDITDFTVFELCQYSNHFAVLIKYNWYNSPHKLVLRTDTCTSI